MADVGPDTLGLPPRFLQLNAADPTWLRELPGLLDRLAARWSLTLEGHFPEIAYNYVAPATRLGGNGRRAPCVLKVSRYLAETANEIAALRVWDGRGAARLLEADAAIGALLLERVEPGTMLVETADNDDDGATLIAAGVLRRLWEPVLAPPDLRGLRSLESWCAAFDRNRAAIAEGAGGFPAEIFKRADAMRRELLASTARPSALHGDLHHYNVLRDHAGGWLAIDPKGLAGDRCFDMCQFFRNPRGPPSVAVNRRRLDIFCAELDLDRQRTKDWCFVHAVLDACWDFEEADAATTPGDRSWQRAIDHAETTLSF